MNDHPSGTHVWRNVRYCFCHDMIRASSDSLASFVEPASGNIARAVSVGGWPSSSSSAARIAPSGIWESEEAAEAGISSRVSDFIAM